MFVDDGVRLRQDLPCDVPVQAFEIRREDKRNDAIGSADEEHAISYAVLVQARSSCSLQAHGTNYDRHHPLFILIRKCQPRKPFTKRGRPWIMLTTFTF